VAADAGDSLPTGRQPIEFRLLGPVEVVIDGKQVTIAASRQKIVLAVLLSEANHVVSVDRMIDALWGSNPPRTAKSQVQITVSALRQVFGDQVIVTRPPGYLIQVPTEALDLARFEALAERASAAAADGRVREAVAGLREALALWYGQAGAGMESAVVQAAATRLNERRISVLQDCLDLELQLGKHRQLIGELSELAAEYPLNERFRGQLMLALYRSGRQADALESLRVARQLLREELGLDPGEELCRLERAILTRDPQLDLPGARQPAGLSGKTSSIPMPRQLPRTISDFVGRDEVLREIARLLTGRGAARRQPDVPVVVLSGRGGTGKTTLAVRAAHLLRPAFPDGQLFIQLRVDLQQGASTLLEHLLQALGIQSDAMPADLDGRAAMYRSWLADRRVLIVIDGAVSANQVRHFLPGVSGCAAVVTSAQRLALEGAREIRIGPLDDSSALTLLTELIGARRIRAEDKAVSELIRLCEGLPLALRIVGAKLAARPHLQVGYLVGQLLDEGRRLDELDLGGASVRASLAVSYDSLDEGARRLFRRLSPFAAYDFAAWVSAPLLDEDIDHAEDLLQQLVQSHLVEARVMDDDSVRYHLHDLVRIYAIERLAHEESAASRLSSIRRLLSCWLFLTTCAHRRIYGGDFGVLHGTAEHWRLPAQAVDALAENPAAWFRRERLSLVAAIYQAGQLGLDELCWDLAVTSATLFESGFYSDDWRASHVNALEIVCRAGNKRGEAALHYSLGTLEVSVRVDDARDHFERSLLIFQEIGDAPGTALATSGLAFVSRLHGDYGQALEHYQQALAGFTSAGDLASQAHTLKTMAQIHADWRDFDAAEELLENSSAICEKLHSPRLTAQTGYQLAELYMRKGQLADAMQAFQSVLQLTSDYGDVIGQMYALVGLGDARRRLGDLPGAEGALRMALELGGNADERLVRSRVLIALAELDCDRNRANMALARIDEAIGVMQELGAARVWQARALELLGRLHERAGRASVAEHAWHTAIELVGTADPTLTDQLTEDLARLRAQA